MTIVYFVIAALALIGAGLLLWLDRQRSTEEHHQRAVWGEQHSFKFRDSDTKLRSVFRRAAMNVPDDVEVRDVAYGVYEGSEAVVFDLQDTATIVAVRRPAVSGVTIDLRFEDVLAPAEDDVELLGAMGPRVMFSNDLDVARRVCDRRMVTLANNAPEYIEILWNEGNWALASMPLTADGERLDVGLQVVRRFADLLRVLPPVQDPPTPPDPRDPHGPIRAELAEEKTDATRDAERRAEAARARAERERLLAEREDADAPAARPQPSAAVPPRHVPGSDYRPPPATGPRPRPVPPRPAPGAAAPGPAGRPPAAAPGAPGRSGPQPRPRPVPPNLPEIGEVPRRRRLDDGDDQR